MNKSQPLLGFGQYAVLVPLLITACAANTDPIRQQGKQLAFDRDKGNCLACHAIEDGESPGNIGPQLSDLSARFKTPQQLKQQIRDASVFNPETSMPPYGRNKILTDEELDHVVDYLWSLE
ncbi:sulfur oxidation c-type cytochrome SoxX [Methylotuvimicrobium buryatense]|uniref:Sulfur oxidation c-type cytochrome SoxX n=1 Tax=Methylotuvimicrobium buryatense TaxID=95641 RepID=A0A4P9UT19_METBY|nr:sulfur oxidation c-type cytochrome SoxX [Methylotuvimicrobium buryatense]QCW83693.1 sulfur oxidation c-type cytochrome SoxX [Methylotuvimicrobium buryatense]